MLLIRPWPEEGTPPDVSIAHVLVATDGSGAANAAVEQAVQIARLFEAELTPLRVVSVPCGLSSPYLPHVAAIARQVTEERKAPSPLAGRTTNRAAMLARQRPAYHALRAWRIGPAMPSCPGPSPGPSPPALV